MLSVFSSHRQISSPFRESEKRKEVPFFFCFYRQKSCAFPAPHGSRGVGKYLFRSPRLSRKPKNRGIALFRASPCVSILYTEPVSMLFLSLRFPCYHNSTMQCPFESHLSFVFLILLSLPLLLPQHPSVRLPLLIALSILFNHPFDFLLAKQHSNRTVISFIALTP